MIWVVFAIMAGAAVFSALWPLSKIRSGAVTPHGDVAFYERQIGEIDRDRARGLLSEGDALGARTLAARRLLAAPAETAEGDPLRARIRSLTAALATLALVPILALSLYVALGRPDLDDAPLTPRLAADPARMSLPEAAARIEARLVTHPDDGRGQDLLAPLYLRLGRYEDAARAAREAVRLLGSTAERQDVLGESLVYAGKGAVGPEARAAFAAVLALAPDDPRARFYTGVAADQAGDKAGAIAIWSALAAGAPADAPWLTAVRERLAAAGVVSGPASAAGRAIAGLPAADQASAIKGMVDGLAARMKGTPADIEGWLRLVRAYAVLGDGAAARAALADARQGTVALPDAPRRLDTLASELALGSAP